MAAQLNRKDVHAAIDTTFSGLKENPYLAHRVRQQAQAESGKPRKLRAGMVFTLVLVLAAAVAAAVALLTPREIIEQVAVPAAQGNDTEDGINKIYSYEDMTRLIQTLDENGLTLDESSTIMQAFRSGHGFWEWNVMEEIFNTAFGSYRDSWTLEERHLYGEAMVEIGEWTVNIYPLPVEGGMTQEEAALYATEQLAAAFGVNLPLESNEEWRVTFELVLHFNYKAEAYDPDRPEWCFYYARKPAGATSYTAIFEPDRQNIEVSATDYDDLRAGCTGISLIRESYINQYGSLAKLTMEQWEEMSGWLSTFTPMTGEDWVWQQSGFTLPPEDAISAEDALTATLAAARQEDAQISTILCCTDGGETVYRILLTNTDGSETVVEVACVSGEVLLCRQLPADADDTERYTPESLQENIPASITEGEEESRRQDEAFRGNADQVAENKALYGPNEAFWPAEVQAATFPAQYSVPTAEDRACVIEIAEAAVVKKFGADALDNLGEYQTGMVFKKDILDEDGDYAIYATVYFTTDPDYLSDGYRIYCFIDNGIIRETDTDLANEGFG